MLAASKLLLDSVTGAVSATNGQNVTSLNIDTLGLDEVIIDIAATTQAASTQAGSPSLLKIQECDTTVSSSFTDIVGLRGGSATATNVDFIIPVGNTAGANAYKFHLAKGGAQAYARYLRVSVTPQTTQTFNVTANGFRNEQMPVTASEANVLALIEA